MKPKEAAGDEATRKQIEALGARLRNLRAERSMSLSAVATGCDVSASLLSQVERGLVVPSLNTLYALSSFFGVSLFELFADDQQEDLVQIVRKNERREIKFAGTTNKYELITPATVTSMSVFELVVNKRGGSAHHGNKPGVTHTNEECVLALSGQVHVHLGDNVHILEEGDSIYYDGTIPHEFRSPGPEPSRVLVVVTPAV